MKFFPLAPYDQFRGQHAAWDALQRAFAHDMGIAYYRYPIWREGAEKHLEPDVLLIHPKYGAFVLEVKGVTIRDIARIDGHTWTMRQGFYAQSIQPVFQVEDQAYAVKGRLEKHRDLRGLLKYHARVILPFIQKCEWLDAGFEPLELLWFKDDLEPHHLLAHCQSCAANSRQLELSHHQLDVIEIALGSGVNKIPESPSTTGMTKAANATHPTPAEVIALLEQKMAKFDEIQIRLLQNPSGPQRLRGLAGSGKTVLLAKRAARLHFAEPQLELAFLFFTRALRDEIVRRIRLEYQFLTEDNSEPDWTRLLVMHAWGGIQEEGFYHQMCRDLQATFQQYRRQGNNFANVCESLETFIDHKQMPEAIGEAFAERLERFDAIFIDEGQDFPSVFYRLAYARLRQPKRLYWAYDEAQGIEQLSVPEAATVFGRNQNGEPRVNLFGVYSGGAPKSMTMRRCYRTPRHSLMVAHAINMGLYRIGGAIQGLTRQEEWRAIGYEILEGDLRKTGTRVIAHRSDEVSLHPIDTNQELRSQVEQIASILEVKRFSSSALERAFIVKSIQADLARGFQADDILIVALFSPDTPDYLEAIKRDLAQQSIKSHIIINAPLRGVGAINIAHVYRAKGNEARRVYACRLEFGATRVYEKGEVHARNSAFVALTRSKIWTVASSGTLDAPIIKEIEMTLEKLPNLEFAAFNRSSLRRTLEIED